MAANGSAPVPGTSLPDLPPLDVASALDHDDDPDSRGGSNTAAGSAPFTPLGGLSTSGALPLLVQMPDGQRRQIELPPTATVRDLRAALPDDTNFDLNFHGQLLRDDNTLANYNIPDAYGHAGGMLKMISDSNQLDPNQKVEILNSACNIVATISRGETDMERLISAALDESRNKDENGTNNASGPGGAGTENDQQNDTQQPSLREVRRGKPSFMSLNLSNLPPPSLNADRATAGASASLAPPTPSQLISKLSAQRPEIFPPSTASRMLALDAAASAGPGVSSGKIEPSLLNEPNPVPGASSSALYPIGTSSPPPPGMGNGEFKRVPTNTWFSEFAKSIAPFPDSGEQPQQPVDQPHPDDSIGDSEDEPSGPGTESQITSDSGRSGLSKGVNSSVGPVVSAATADATGSSTNPSPPQISTSTSHRATSIPQAVPTAARSTTVGGIGVTTMGTASSTTTGAAPSSASEKNGVAASAPASAGTAAATNNKPTMAAGASGASSSAAGPSAKPEATPVSDKPAAPQPKKRGRKRKNPELSEEERKALRQAQNRASAKQSRMRRKVMAAEYEKRVNTLEGENETLRDTVAALSDRLQFLQNLLTVSVQKRPPGAGGHM